MLILSIFRTLPSVACFLFSLFPCLVLSPFFPFFFVVVLVCLEHPGGTQAISRYPGADNTVAFHGPQHPAKVHHILPEYYIGDLAEEGGEETAKGASSAVNSEGQGKPTVVKKKSRKD